MCILLNRYVQNVSTYIPLTDNTMVKRQTTKGQIIINKI